MSTKSSKKQRLSSSTRRRKEDDNRVSSLPDTILCHILSFLPTKDAVPTTILSKRWVQLWLSVLTLDFFDLEKFWFKNPSLKTPPDLCRLVHSVMLSRHNTLPIPTFRLQCPCNILQKEPNSDLIQLINQAIQRRTQTLELDMFYNRVNNYFLSNIFTCRTLTVLKLKRLTFWEDIPLIDNNISPIKTLHLDNLNFLNHTDIINFLLSFPLLEELETNEVQMFPRRTFVPKTAQDKIKCLPNLLTAKLSDNEPIPLFLLSRTHTSLSIKLTWACYVQVPIFYNLTQIEILSDLVKLQSWPNKWMWILEMLQNTPKLQYLTIHEEVENGNDHEEYNWEDPKIVPESLSSQLKTCLFRNYRGNKCELQFVEYIMRNSKVLINMTIHTVCSIDLNAKFQMLQKLSVCPRGCKLVFE